MPCRITILGSGSGGNCAYIETAETRLLVDAGFSARQIRQRLAGIGRTPENLTAILITHEHSDHVQGLPLIAHRLGISVYCNRLTLDALEFQQKIKFDGHVFETGTSFDIGDVRVDTFSIPHDAQDPVGFLLRTDEGNVGFLTDLGHSTRLVMERIREANVLMLETNYDLKLLQEDLRRPWSLKQRIMGRHGHLSNEAAADMLEQIVSENLQHLYLGHLSKDCNRPELAHQTVSDRLHRVGASHVKVEVTSQAAPSPTLCLQGSLVAHAPRP